VVSDAGTPGICDPGAQLAASCIKNTIPLHPIPGASAVISALSVCGYETSEFTFIGFLPFRGKERLEKMSMIRNIQHVVVFFEAPHRILETFELFVREGHQDRSCMCAREQTKLYEEFRHGSIGECKELYDILYMT
jgi:16S rRNA (cytidine1402-2'-O)-methyltransferase